MELLIMLKFSNNKTINVVDKSTTKIRLFLSFSLFFLMSLLVVCCFIVKADTLTLPEFKEGTLGKYLQYFQESNNRLTLAEAQQKFLPIKR